MKKIVLLTTLTILLVACGKNENKQSTDALIAAKNSKALLEKKAALQAEIAKIEEALASMDVKTVEALVSVATLRDTTFTHYVEIQGNVDTKENILIQPEMGGVLTSLTVKTGDKVSKGQILGRVDDAGMSQQLAGLENQYELAKTTFERQKNLWEKKIGSEIQFLQAQTQMVSAQKAVAQMKAQLAKTVIRAPFSGVIDEIFVEKGEVVAPNPQGLMRIVNLSNMYVSTTVPETYVGKIKVGDQVEVFLSSLNKSYLGKVRQVGSYINPNNRSFGIEVSVPNPDNLLRPNLVAQLRILDYQNKDAMVVPTSVIQKDSEGNSYVYLVTTIKDKTGIAKKTVITVGKSSGNNTEVLAGLNPTDVIVTEGVTTISEGMKLNF